MTCAMLLDMAADCFPGRVAITAPVDGPAEARSQPVVSSGIQADAKSGCEIGAETGAQLTYRALQAASRRAADLLSGAGRYRYAALLDTASPAVPVLLFGAAYAGVPYVPLSYRLTERELQELLERISPALLVADPVYVERLHLPAGIDVWTRNEFLAQTRALNAEASPRELSTTAPEPQSIAIQLFTSGTTGKPKAAVLRHENTLAYVLGTVDLGSADESEATLICVPPYHIAGIAAVLTATYAGRRIVMLPGFDEAQWLRVCAAERITHAFVVPTMLARIVQHLESGGQPPLPALRAIAYGGGRMPQSVIERAMRLLPTVDFTNAYGLTETSSTICLLGPDEHRAAFGSTDPLQRRRLGSVGRPLPGLELQIRDVAGRSLGPEQAGVIFVRGGQVSGEYRDTGSTLDADGWFCTRDTGWMDSEGFVYLDGRADDIIVRGGENISPGEIEAALLEHPAVSDAAAVAIPSEEWGEAVAAAVVLRPGVEVSAAGLQEWVRGRLRSSRVPERILFKQQLPYNEMGKVLRRAVRAEVLAM